MRAFNFDNRVAVVTGAGSGLGRSHAKALAAKGAKVVVNDLGTDVDGVGSSLSAAESVVKEIIDSGGIAIPNGANVTNEDQVNDLVDDVLDKWGRIDILVNNAGILRDKTFANMSLSDFRAVVDTHLMGAVTCCKAVWKIMCSQEYGRIVMTSSSSGLYGNFGQSNYGAAKMALIGLMNVLSLEGAKHGVVVNALAPIASTRMTKGLLPKEALDLLTVESVSVGLLYLASEHGKSRLILSAGAGGYASTIISETEGIFLGKESQSLEEVLKHINKITDRNKSEIYSEGWYQTKKFIQKAANQEDVNIT